MTRLFTKIVVASGLPPPPKASARLAEARFAREGGSRTSEAVHLVLQAGGMGKRGELFVLNMGEPVRIMDLAKDLIRLSGFTTEQIPIVTTGVRPGEKLEEALWEDDATVEPTAHPDILRVGEPQMPAGDLGAALQALEQAIEEGDGFEIEAILCDWIPTFAPSFTGLPSGVSKAADRRG